MTLRMMALMFLEADFMVRKDRVKIRWREPFFLEFFLLGLIQRHHGKLGQAEREVHFNGRLRLAVFVNHNMEHA